MLLLGLACSSRPATSVPRVTLTPCRLKGVSEEVRCGTLDVFEDRHRRSGKVLHLNIAVVPALAPSPLPDPLFILAGGPGQAATEVLKEVLPVFEKVHRRRDLVFVDQRGTGKSNPLTCLPSEDAGIAQQFEETFDEPAFRHCLAEYERAGTHPGLYTTDLAMDDLDDVRAALGYLRVNLWGGSYGTRAGLVYLRQHPDRVRTAVLDGVAPPTMSLPLATAEDGQRAFELIFRNCDADAACHRAYPDLQARFEALLAKLEATPLHTRVHHPRTGAPVDLTLTRASFLTNLHGILYAPEITVLLPLIIDRASDGDFQPFVTQALGLTAGLGQGFSQGMHFSILCTEDVPAATPAARAQHNRGTYFRDTLTQEALDVCAFWPKGSLPPDFHAEVHSDTPVLLLSGELDPVTPPKHAEEAREGLPHGVHVVVPGVGHGASGQGCVPRLISEFLDKASAEGLDVGCVKSLTRPPFFVSFAGPTP